MKNKEKIKKIGALSLVIIVAAQLYLNPFTTNFRISIAVICFAACVYLTGDVAVIPLTVLSAAGILLTRLIASFLQGQPIGESLLENYPEFVFYLIYGGGIAIFCRAAGQRYSLTSYLIFIVCIDYFANFCELMIRQQLGELDARTQIGLILIACCRTLLLWLILFIFNRYRLTLLKRSNAERYQRLVIMISRLGGEVTWMKKNTALIENTMNTSYDLYNRLHESGDSELSQQALKVAKDIHEIKKEYFLIMRGISEAMEEESAQEGMEMRDLLMILSESLNREFADQGKSASVRLDLRDRLYTEDPYQFLSVFHNLFTNAVEASEKNFARIRVTERREDDAFVFHVTDDGPGIDDETIGQIFSPRFSTKINYETGVIARGLGLPIVRDIIEKDLDGTITAASHTEEGVGTDFTIRIPAGRLEVISS